MDLSDEERLVCQEILKKLKGTSQKVKRANILLKADKGGTDAKIADALDCWMSTIENIRKRFVEMGFEQTLERKKWTTPPVGEILYGDQEAKIIVMRLGDSPKGFRKWTLRLQEHFS